MEKKRVLFINGHLNPGGVERSLTDVLRYLDHDSYDVTLLLLEEYGDYCKELPEEVTVRLFDLHNAYGNIIKSLLRCIRVRDLNCLKMRLLMAAAKLFGSPVYRLARRFVFGRTGYDFAIAFRPGICTDLAAFAAPAEKRVTWWHHGEYTLTGRAEKDYRRDCARMNKIVAVSEPCRNMLGERLPEYKDKITVVPNIIDADLIQSKSAAYDPYNDDGMLHIVSIGRLSPEKHFDNLIPAAEKLLENGICNFRWYLIGDGSEYRHISELIRSAGLADHIILTGNQSNPYPWLKGADLFVHPSYVESQGIVILEAMALGIPCVVTRSAGPLEFIRTSENGLLTERDPKDLAAKVAYVLNDHSLYDTIKSNSKCPEMFSPDHICSQIKTIIEQVSEE